MSRWSCSVSERPSQSPKRDSVPAFLRPSRTEILPLCVLVMMSGNNPTSQIRASESYEVESEDSTEIDEVRKDGKNRQRFEASLRDQLIWSIGHRHLMNNEDMVGFLVFQFIWDTRSNVTLKGDPNNIFPTSSPPMSSLPLFHATRILSIWSHFGWSLFQIQTAKPLGFPDSTIQRGPSRTPDPPAGHRFGNILWPQ